MPRSQRRPNLGESEARVISSFVHRHERFSMQIVQNVQYQDILPRIRVGVSAPKARLNNTHALSAHSPEIGIGAVARRALFREI